MSYYIGIGWRVEIDMTWGFWCMGESKAAGLKIGMESIGVRKGGKKRRWTCDGYV